MDVIAEWRFLPNQGMRWCRSELDDDQRADGGPVRLGVGVRVLTSAGTGIIRRVTRAGQAVIDLDAGGTVTQPVDQIVRCLDDREPDGGTET